jgi:hypothetical protein
MSAKRILFLLISLGLMLSSCNSTVEQSNPTSAPASRATDVPPTRWVEPVETQTSLPTLAATATRTTAPTATLTETPAPSETPTQEPTITPIPTYAILRGVVIPDKVGCMYGPGAMYLYLYGMVKGATQDIIGRTDTGKWVLTRARGDKTVCWVKASLLDIKGDVMSVEMVYPDKYSIPPSNQHYRFPWDVVAIRKGDQVTISWKSDPLRPGDEESATSVLYVVESWICQGGKLIFTPLGAYQAQVIVTDEAGCTEPSHGRVFFSEKHGYTGPTEILWPPAQ